jgi:hypothetical protein
VPSLSIWGRINTLNGRNYIVAQTTPEPHMENGEPVIKTLYFMSQDGVRWSDLPEVDDTHRDVAEHLMTLLQGDPKKKHYWPPKPDDEEEEPGALRQESSMCHLQHSCKRSSVQHTRTYASKSVPHRNAQSYRFLPVTSFTHPRVQAQRRTTAPPSPRSSASASARCSACAR